MIIIKNLNFKFISLLFTCFFVVSCGVKKVNKDQYLTNQTDNNTCIIKENELNEFRISNSDLDIENLEFDDYFKSKNKYDVIVYSAKSGEKDYVIERWFLNENSNWIHVKIINGIKTSAEIKANSKEILSILNKLENKSYLKVCKNCFGCEYGLMMIKNNELFFKYHYEGIPYENLSNIDKESIKSFVQAYKYFTSTLMEKE